MPLMMPLEALALTPNLLAMLPGATGADTVDVDPRDHGVVVSVAVTPSVGGGDGVVAGVLGADMVRER